MTFASPFVLGGSDEVLPAGAYIVETDEELLEGLSFPAYRRILTLIHLHAEPKYPGRMRTLTIDPTELDAAFVRDKAAAEPTNSQDDNQMTLKQTKDLAGKKEPSPAEHGLSDFESQAATGKEVEEDLLAIPPHLRRQAD